jgi:hypothetical protein
MILHPDICIYSIFFLQNAKTGCNNKLYTGIRIYCILILHCTCKYYYIQMKKISFQDTITVWVMVLYCNTRAYPKVSGLSP